MQLLGPYIHRGKPKDVEKLRVKMKKEFGDFQTNQSWLDSVQVVTKYCTAAGLGNCGELASMACGQLHALGVRNVDYVQISTVQIDTRLVQGNPVLPHCICVLGRTLGRTDDSAYIGLPNEWGPDAVVCDPWDRVVYPASRYMEFWTGIVEAAKGGALTCQLLHRFT